MNDMSRTNDLRHVIEADRAHVWHHLSQHKPYETIDPRIMIEGRGMRLWDATGKARVVGRALPAGRAGASPAVAGRPAPRTAATAASR